jgi:hypothetical protein
MRILGALVVMAMLSCGGGDDDGGGGPPDADPFPHFPGPDAMPCDPPYLEVQNNSNVGFSTIRLDGGPNKLDRQMLPGDPGRLCEFTCGTYDVTLTDVDGLACTLPAVELCETWTITNDEAYDGCD